MAIAELQTKSTPVIPGAPDAELIAAWERRMAAWVRYNALPFSELPDETHSPEEAECWAIIEDAEEVIRSSCAKSPRGVEIQLWTSLFHSASTSDDDNAAMERGDLGYFEGKGDSLNWNVRLAIAALKSLRAMEVRA